MFFQAYRIKYKFSKPYLWPAYIECYDDDSVELTSLSYVKNLEVVFDENFENVKFHLYSEERYREEKTIWELGVRDRSTCEEIKNELDICARHIEKILENGRILEDLYKEFDIELYHECECDNIVEDIGCGDFLIIDGEKILIRHYNNRQNFVVTMIGKLLSESAKMNFFGKGQEYILME